MPTPTNPIPSHGPTPTEHLWSLMLTRVQGALSYGKCQFEENGWTWRLTADHPFGSGIALAVLSEGEGVTEALAGKNTSELTDSATAIIKRKGIRPESQPAKAPDPQKHWTHAIEPDALRAGSLDPDGLTRLSIAISLKKIAATLEGILINMQVRP